MLAEDCSVLRTRGNKQEADRSLADMPQRSGFWSPWQKLHKHITGGGLEMEGTGRLLQATA